VATPELAKAKGKELAEEDFAHGKYRKLACFWIAHSCHNEGYPGLHVRVEQVSFYSGTSREELAVAMAGEAGYNDTMRELLVRKSSSLPPGK